MKLRHVLATVGFGFLTLGMMCTGLLLWESETHTLERHFEAREARLHAALLPVMQAALENPRVTDVTGPIEQCVRTAWMRNSSPFGERADYTLAARGPKGDATIQLELRFREPRWTVEKFTVIPADGPLPPNTFTKNEAWDAPFDVDLEELEHLDEDIQSSVSLGMQQGEGPR